MDKVQSLNYIDNPYFLDLSFSENSRYYDKVLEDTQYVFEYQQNLLRKIRTYVDTFEYMYFSDGRLKLITANGELLCEYDALARPISVTVGNQEIYYSNERVKYKELSKLNFWHDFIIKL